MAWLVQEKSGVFHLAFRFQGEQAKRTLKTRSEKTANAILHRVEENIRLVEAGRLSVPSDADIATFFLSDGKLNQRKPATKRLLLGQLLGAYKENLPQNAMAAESLRVAEIHMGHLVRILGERKQLQTVNFSSLQSYVAKRSKEPGKRGRNVSAGTIRKEIATFRSVWNWARRAEYVSIDCPCKQLQFPTLRMKPPFQTWGQVQRRIERGRLSAADEAELWDCLYLDTTKLNELLEHIENQATYDFLFPMSLLAAHTGARRSELCRSRTDDFDLEQGLLVLREKKRQRGKETTRHVPLTRRVRTVMSEWIIRHPSSIYTFPSEHHVSRTRSRQRRENDESVYPDEATDHLSQVLLGTKWEGIRGWHMFRHTFISSCASAGTDQRMIDSWVGHQTEAMRMRYRHLFPTVQQQELSRVFD